MEGAMVDITERHNNAFGSTNFQYNFRTLQFVIFIFFGLVSGINSIDYYSNNSSGIYYHSDGYLYPSHSSWTVFISLDFSDLNEFFELGRFYLVYLNSTIGYYNFNYSSGINLQDVKLLEKNLGECKMKIDSLNNIFRTDNSRVKRSWLPFLGNMLHTVAGVATIKDVQHFQHAVRLLTDIQKDT